MTAHLRDRVGDLDGRVGTFDRLTRCGRQGCKQCTRPFEAPRDLHVGSAGGVAAVQTLQPRPPVLPSPRVVRGDGDRRNAIGVEIAEALGHTNDRLVLSEQRIELAERAIGNQDGLRQIAGSITTNWARSGIANASTNNPTATMRRMVSLLWLASDDMTWLVGGQLDVARQVHLDPVTLTNRDGREAIQEAAHDLSRSLAGGIADAASNDHAAVAVCAAQSGGAEELTEPGDQPDSRGRSKRGQVVLIDAVA